MGVPLCVLSKDYSVKAEGGDEVGVTLHHPHGQIYAFPFIPQVQQTALRAFEGGYDLAADI